MTDEVHHSLAMLPARGGAKRALGDSDDSGISQTPRLALAIIIMYTENLSLAAS